MWNSYTMSIKTIHGLKWIKDSIQCGLYLLVGKHSRTFHSGSTMPDMLLQPAFQSKLDFKLTDC